MRVSGVGGSCREDARFNWDSENQQCNQSVVDVTRTNERTNERCYTGSDYDFGRRDDIDDSCSCIYVLEILKTLYHCRQ